MSETKDQAQEPKVLSKEEVEVRRAEMIAFYEAEMPLQEAMANYEETITRIEVAKMTRFEIMMVKAQVMQKQEDEKKEGDPNAAE